MTKSYRNKHVVGYIARFILETAMISQLFCHQIIWNMRANCFKDDAAEIVCPLGVVNERPFESEISRKML